MEKKVLNYTVKVEDLQKVLKDIDTVYSEAVKNAVLMILE